jgi:hypothetical protein
MKNQEKTECLTIGRGSIVLVTVLIVLTWATVTPGQRGMGDSKGVAQQRLKPSIVRISGRLEENKTHPCESTTGEAELGTHLILKDKHGKELNIHLGPAPVLSEVVKQLTVGKNLDLLGFRTDKMPSNNYAATTLILANRVIQLRDSDLRPYWSRSRPGGQARSPSTTTTAGQRAAMRRDRLYYCPRLRQFRCSHGSPRSHPRRRCRGRNFYRK